jgi:hypothetical protein
MRLHAAGPAQPRAGISKPDEYLMRRIIGSQGRFFLYSGGGKNGLKSGILQKRTF